MKTKLPIPKTMKPTATLKEIFLNMLIIFFITLELPMLLQKYTQKAQKNINPKDVHFKNLLKT